MSDARISEATCGAKAPQASATRARRSACLWFTYEQRVNLAMRALLNRVNLSKLRWHQEQEQSMTTVLRALGHMHSEADHVLLPCTCVY